MEKNRCTFTEVIAKIKLGYRFLEHPAYEDINNRTRVCSVTDVAGVYLGVSIN